MERSSQRGGGANLYPVDLIVEQGNNYIRYNNGVQICWDRYSQSAVDVLTHTFVFSKPFVDIPSVQLTNESSQANGMAGTITNLSRTGFLGAYYGIIASDVATGMSYIAIGKWK